MDKTIDRWTDPDGNGYAFKDTVARAQNRATIDRMNAETADRKAEVNTERKRIDNLIKELPATAGEYQQSKLVLHSYGNTVVKCTTTSGNYTNVPVFTTDQGGPLSSLYTKKSNYQIAVNKSGLYLFELRIHVNSLIANKRVELAPFVNDSRNAALASSYNTAGNFTLTQVAALPLWLSANDTVDFKIAPIDAAEVNLQLGDVLVYAIDWEDKFKITDYTGYAAETKDIRTGADGIVYGTAGEAVRKQIGNLTENINDYILKTSENIAYSYISEHGTEFADMQTDIHLEGRLTFGDESKINEDGYHFNILPNKEYIFAMAFNFTNPENLFPDNSGFRVYGRLKNGYLAYTDKSNECSLPLIETTETQYLIGKINTPSAWTDIHEQRVVPEIYLYKEGNTFDLQKTVKAKVTNFILCEYDENIFNTFNFQVQGLFPKDYVIYNSNMLKPLEDKINDINIAGKNTIVCWGDSLTEGTNKQTPWTDTLQKLVGQQYKVINKGIGGQKVEEIAIRQGAYTVYLKPCTLSNKAFEDVEVECVNENGETIQFILDNVLFNDDVEGAIAIHNKKQVAYLFDNNKGFTITRNFFLKTLDFEKYRNTTMILWCGSNNSPNSTTIHDVIKLLENMVSYNNNNNYIVIGVTSLAAMPELKKCNEELRKSFEYHYLDISYYLRTYGLEDAGITPTERDIEDISKGDIPYSLRIDAVHLTSKGNEIIGRRIFEKGKNLGYW